MGEKTAVETRVGTYMHGTLKRQASNDQTSSRYTDEIVKEGGNCQNENPAKTMDHPMDIDGGEGGEVSHNLRSSGQPTDISSVYGGRGFCRYHRELIAQGTRQGQKFYTNLSSHEDRSLVRWQERKWNRSYWEK
jgi:hypothetical protein